MPVCADSVAWDSFSAFLRRATVSASRSFDRCFMGFPPFINVSTKPIKKE